jgi:hypothetical protein
MGTSRQLAAMQHFRRVKGEGDIGCAVSDHGRGVLRFADTLVQPLDRIERGKNGTLLPYRNI